MGCPLRPVESRGRGALSTSAERALIALVVGGSLILGFVVAIASGVRVLGGVVLLIGGGWCAWRLWRMAGPVRTIIVGVVYVAAFVVSHPLGDVIGTWPSLIVVSVVAALTAYWAGRPVSA